MGKMIILISCVLIMFFSGFVGCKDTDMIIVIDEPTELLLKADLKDASGNKVISILENGVKGRVVEKKYSKDFLYYKIQTDNGLKGYVMHDSKLRIKNR